MSNLYQDAILDAKALRASAMANAKAALEEAFEPKIKELVNLKLTEELDELSDLEEAMKDDQVEETYHKDGVEESADINEAELEEILAQLEELSGHGDEKPMEEEEEMKHESLNEAEEDDDDDDDDAEDSESENEEGGEVSDATKVIEITVGDLKEILKSVNQESMPVQDMGDEMPSDDSETEAESEISLEEILAELEEEEGYADVSSSPGYEAGKQHPQPSEAKDKMEEELEEAKSTIETLRQNLQEVNLLNAKYLYMNKLFKSKSLTESEKVKVINALDRAVSVKEVKNTYETLKESFVPKKQLKESIGFASQPAGVAPKKPIIEQDSMFNRWQKLAGIK